MFAARTIAFSVLLHGCGAPPRSAPMQSPAPVAPLELVLTNGKIFTADPARPWAEALAIGGDRIVGVGTASEIRALPGHATTTRVIDLGGRVVIPGINDAHIHAPDVWSPHPAEALTREQAVVAYTRGSAYAEGKETEKGTLAPGMLADLAVLTADIFTIPAEQLPATTAWLTIVGGELVHDASR